MLRGGAWQRTARRHRLARNRRGAAVEQADAMIRNGEAPAEEKVSIDCELITAENADDYGVFAKK